MKHTDRQIDLFYQLLHRSGYNISLDTFVASLLSDGDPSVDTDTRDKGLPTKNAVSRRRGRMPQLSKYLLNFLSDECTNHNSGFVLITSKVKMHKTSADGTTTKIAVELQDGHVVESVLMRHEGRVTLCVSSQVG